jgi:hypothetical protein
MGQQAAEFASGASQGSLSVFTEQQREEEAEEEDAAEEYGFNGGGSTQGKQLSKSLSAVQLGTNHTTRHVMPLPTPTIH